MKQLRSALILLAGVVVSFAAPARDAVQIIDHENVPVATGSGKPASSDAVGAAIANAAKNGKRVWVVSKVAPDRLQATYNVRQHTIAVNINYSAKAYSIHYLSSTNMKFNETNGVKYIHPFYNTWVDELKRGISAELTRL
jgi:acetylglutamate kinase